MIINVSIHSEEPLYQQIKNQLINYIVNNKVSSGERLPSIRVLAKDLGVGVITVKRAYDDLVLEGYLVSKEALGYYVNVISIDKMKNEMLNNFKNDLKQRIMAVKELGLSQDEISKILKELCDE